MYRTQHRHRRPLRKAPLLAGVLLSLAGGCQSDEGPASLLRPTWRWPKGRLPPRGTRGGCDHSSARCIRVRASLSFGHLLPNPPRKPTRGATTQPSFTVTTQLPDNVWYHITPTPKTA
jgi:hypothetical protein